MAFKELPTLPFAAFRVVPRKGGGAFVLGEHGELVRVSPRGDLSSLGATQLRDLSVNGPFVCGSTEDGSLQCLIDHHEDYTCSSELPLPTLLSVQGVPLGPWRLDDASDALCVRASAGATRCFRITASCEQHCLAFPACAPTRCVDPCVEGATPELKALAWPAKNFLSRPPLAVTDGG